MLLIFTSIQFHVLFPWQILLRQNNLKITAIKPFVMASIKKNNSQSHEREADIN